MKQCLICYLILLLLILQPGCGGNDAVVTIPTVTPVATVTDELVLSTINELESTSSEFTAGQEGQMEFGDLKLVIPSGSLETNGKIEIARVTIEDKNGKVYRGRENDRGDLYEISTGQEDEALELDKPVKIELKIDPNSPDPGLAIWGGDGWIPIDRNYINYDKNSNILTGYIGHIEEDLNQSILTGTTRSDQSSPIVVTYFKNIKYEDLNYSYPNYYDNEKHFTIHYPKNFTDYKAMSDAFEAYYDAYINYGYEKPVDFLFNIDPNDPNSELYKSAKIMVYVSIDPNAAGWASSYGIIKMPPDWQKFAAHELFHMSQHNYLKRTDAPTWLFEVSATGIEGYMYNRYHNKKDKYDIQGDAVIWDNMNHFSYSLDCEKKGNDNVGKEYKNGFIWAYFLKKYGMSVFKDIIAASFTKTKGQKLSLSYVNGKFTEKAKTSLITAYFEAFEDFFIYGQIYNKNNFGNFSEREPNIPLSSPDLTFSEKSNYDAYEPNSNIYYNSKTIPVDHVSGKYFNFKSNGIKGNLHVDIIGSRDNDFAVKIYSIKNKDNTSQITGSKEYINQGVNDIIFPYNENVTDISILLENKSLDDDMNVSVKIYGTKE